MAERLANGAITALDALHHGEDSDKGQKLSERGTVPKITKTGSPTTPGVLKIRPQTLTIVERLANGAITALDALHHGEESDKGQKLTKRGTMQRQDHPPHPASSKYDPQALTMAKRLANGAITALDALHHGEDSDKGQKLSERLVKDAITALDALHQGEDSDKGQKLIERGTVSKITKTGSSATPGVLQIRSSGAGDGREACQRCDHRT